MTDPGFDEQRPLPPLEAHPPAPEEPPAAFVYRGPRPSVASTGAVLLVVFGALGVLVTLVILGQFGSADDDGQSVDTIDYLIWWGQLLFSSAQIVAGVFVWRGAEWARLLGIVLCGLNMLGGLASLFGGAVLPAFVNLAANGGIIATITRPDVREWCAQPK